MNDVSIDNAIDQLISETSSRSKFWSSSSSSFFSLRYFLYRTRMKAIEAAKNTIQKMRFMYPWGSSLVGGFIWGEYQRIIIVVIMSPLEKIRNTFARKGYRDRANITQAEFFSLLNELKGDTFDEDVAMELWEQAQPNNRNETSVTHICSVIEEAQTILTEKLLEVEEDIENKEQERREVESSRVGMQQKERDLQRIRNEIEELQKDREEFEQDLALVSQPFGIDFKLDRNLRPTGLPKPRESRRARGASIENQELQHIFYVVLAMALIEVIVIYKKYDFLNLLVLVTSMAVFLFNYFDSTYLKLCGGLASISVVADFTWLIMYAGSFWSLSALSEHSSAESGYLKLIVLLTLVNIAAKVYLVYLILKQNNIGAQNEYTINPFEGVTLNVTGNDNLITQTCKGAVGGYL